MTFFNKKEDVIKIELTPYGRRLLSKGQFKPVYYSFLDDNILYDGTAADIVEDTKDIKNRILNQTPYLRPQTNYKGVESSINNFSSKLSDNFDDDNLIPERVEKLQYALGSNLPTSNKTSEISATFLLGEISSSAQQYSGSGVAPVNIPQLNCVIENTIEVKTQTKNLDVQFEAIRKPDGTYVEMTEEEILIFLQDLEGFNNKDNFSVEVFMYDSQDTNTLIPMKMLAEKPRIVDDILIDDVDIQTMFEPNVYANEFFTIVFDDNINRSKICKGISRLKRENIYVSLEVDCEDIDKEGFEVDLYQSRTTNDDLEKC